MGDEDLKGDYKYGNKNDGEGKFSNKHDILKALDSFKTEVSGWL